MASGDRWPHGCAAATGRLCPAARNRGQTPGRVRRGQSSLQEEGAWWSPAAPQGRRPPPSRDVLETVARRRNAGAAVLISSSDRTLSDSGWRLVSDSYEFGWRVRTAGIWFG